MHNNRDTGRKLRTREKRRYTEELEDEEIEGSRMFSVEEKLASDRFKFSFVKEMKSEDFTLKYIQENGFDSPILVKDKNGLGIKVPDKTFTVNDVRICVGNRRILDVMDVITQKDIEMTMKEWCQYYENPVRERLLNVISLEFSHTKLENMVEAPTIVRKVDWVDWVWPKHLKLMQTESTNLIDDMKYPKVQKYCLMSVKGCYTDFHIDFGGTSVWYHVLKGNKIFWLIPPSERNIQLYEQWILSGRQTDIFFGDTVEQCQRIEIKEGNTFFIPTGWIHAVYTSEDSLIFGGNFLHSFAIEKQLRVSQVEDTVRVPSKFRYPFYNEMLWYVLQRYVYCLTGKNHLSVDENGNLLPENQTPNSFSSYNKSPIKLKSFQNNCLTSFELNGLKAIIMSLLRLSHNKRSVPDLISNPEALLNDAKLLVDDHNNDEHRLAATGKFLLYWSTKLKNLSPCSSPSLASSSLTSTIINSTSSTTPTSTCITTSSSSSSSSSSGLSVTAQLRQIKNTSFNLFNQSKLNSSQSLSESTNKKPTSPPTRPISSNQYLINSHLNNKAIDPIPSSFAQLIATTGVGNTNRTNFCPPFLKPSFSNQSTQNISTSTSNTLDNNYNHANSPHEINESVTLTDFKEITNKSYNSSAIKINNTVNDNARRRRTRCKKCESCSRADCGDCHFCKDMKKFGGPGRMKQSCIARQCMAPVLPHTACCMICGKDGWDKLIPGSSYYETQSSLLECSKCWEIVHPTCLKEKNPKLPMESIMSDELPNSWECPKCVLSPKYSAWNKLQFEKLQLKTPQSLNSNMRRDVYDFNNSNVLPDSMCKKLRKSEIFEQGLVNSENAYHSKRNELEEKSSFDDKSDKSDKSDNSLNKNISSANKLPTLHVRSCARFPLLSEAIKQNQTQKNQSLNLEKSSKNSEVAKSVRVNKKHNETSRDRLFRSLKGLKKNSEMSRLSGMSNGYSVKKILYRSVSSNHQSSDSNLESDHSAHSSQTSSTISSNTTSFNKTCFNRNENNSSKNSFDPSLYYDDDTDNEVENRLSPSSEVEEEEEKTSNLKNLNSSCEEKQIIKPKYVVRPAPLPEDLSETEIEEESDEEEDEFEEKKEMKKKRKKFFQKLKKKQKGNLVLNREVILPVLFYLSKRDILNCMLVCKLWNGFCINPKLWKNLDLTRKTINSDVLKGIVRRQPLHLNLSWTKLTKTQLSWLLPRLPQLETLSLSGCSSNTILTLCSCNCPLIKSLDLSWVNSINDNLIKDLLSSPPDSRPGLLDTKTRLRSLVEVKLAGSDISDISVRLLSNHLSQLAKLDLSNCHKVTDMGVAVLGTAKTSKLISLNLSSCSNISDTSLESLKRCQNLNYLDVRDCNQVTVAACLKFVISSASKVKLIMKQSKLIQARK